MKRLVLTLLVLIASISLYAQDLTFNCRILNYKSAKVVDDIKRKIKRVDNKIIFEKYFTDKQIYGENGEDLILTIDKIEKKKRFSDISARDWYYCTGIEGKYIVVGLDSAHIHLYYIATEVDIFEEIFDALKE